MTLALPLLASEYGNEKMEDKARDEKGGRLAPSDAWTDHGMNNHGVCQWTDVNEWLLNLLDHYLEGAAVIPQIPFIDSHKQLSLGWSLKSLFGSDLKDFIIKLSQNSKGC